MVREELFCVIHSMSPSTLGESGGGAHLYYPQCVSLYLGWRRGWGSFALSTVCLLDGDREGLICIIHSVLPLHLGWRWGRGSFASSTVCSLYLGGRWGRSSFVSFTECLPLPLVEVGEGLICITHSVPPSTFGGGGGGAHPHHPPSTLGGGGGGAHLHHPQYAPFTLGGGGGGAHLYHSQSVSLYLWWRWGRGSFVSPTVCLLLPLVEVGEGLICIIHSGLPLPLVEVGEGLICIIHSGLPLPWVEVGEGLICIIHSVPPSTFGGGGGAHLCHPRSVSFYLWWRWGRGSFVSSTVCLPLPLVEVGEGLICIIHSGLGGGSFASFMSPSTLGEGLICIIYSVPPSTLGGSGGGAHFVSSRVSSTLGGGG